MYGREHNLIILTNKKIKLLILYKLFIRFMRFMCYTIMFIRFMLH